jgi:branched-chain amino acid transport system permease protein
MHSGRTKKVLGVVGVLAVLGMAAPQAGPFILLLTTKALIFGMLAMSTDLLLGYTGLPSLGQAAFMGVGAYFAAILANRYGFGLGCDLAAVLAGGALAGALLAALFGLLAMRATGVYFLMITLALGMVVWGVVYRWHSLTGGDNGMNLATSPVCLVNLGDPAIFFYLVLVLFVLLLAGLYVLVNSPFGRGLLGIRESEIRMRILGYHTWLHKYLVFIVSGACGGLSGVLWVHLNHIVSPEVAILGASVDTLLMVILGGPGTLVGPAIGAAIVVFLREYFSTLVTWWLYVLGAVYILTIYYLPEGLMGIPDYLRTAHRSKGAAEPAAGVSIDKSAS